MGIIKLLLKEGYCFGVMQSYSWLTKSKMMQNQEWEIIAAKTDYPSLRKYGFELLNNPADLPRNRNPENIISRVLSLDEISEFRTVKDAFFSKSIETEDGIIWETKSKSLKQILNIK